MLNVTSLREQVYLYLREQMHTGNLLPGSTINPTELSEKLGISKTPLRDALIRLETEGFVKILPRRGVRVNAINVRDVKNYYDIIGALEASVILDVFDNIGPNHIMEMERLNGVQRDAVLTGDFTDYYQANLDFHEVYLKLTDNSFLRELILPMKQRLYDFPRRSYIIEWELTNLDEHEHFIQCIKNNDKMGAAKVMRDIHWSFKVQEKNIRKFYKAVAEQIQAEHELRKNGDSNGF